MRVWTQELCRRPGRLAAALVWLSLAAWPAPAAAQYGTPSLSDGAVGENYHIEVSGTLWNPTLFGQISSEQFGQVGTTIDFLTDLDYVQQRFKDLRIVLRPSRKVKFRIQYTPISYTAETRFTRDIIFNNIKFPLSVPIDSEFNWKVWRLGYEYDVFYRSRGFVGFLLEARVTDFSARLKTNSPIFSPPIDEFTALKVPFPAFGVVGRGYPLPQLAINFELSAFKLPESIDPNYKAKYVEWDLSGTYNATNNVGIQAGFRKVTNAFTVKKDFGDLRFSGLWFGAALRY